MRKFKIKEKKNPLRFALHGPAPRTLHVTQTQMDEFITKIIDCNKYKIYYTNESLKDENIKFNFCVKNATNINL